ncbi:MAG: Hsp20/alpha crystallin family protein [Candidatus Babeliaceae bacterium]|nr:Hsp20/alpha crystallin family protein [Candidatus Babeliaceae bacterium]
MKSLLHWHPLTQQLEEAFEHEQFGFATDVYEADGEIIVKMHIPEIDPDKIEIDVDEDILRVTGSREIIEESSDRQYYQREIQSGHFERVIPLPREVDAKETTADYKDGVLRIALPIKEGKETARIKVKRK